MFLNKCYDEILLGQEPKESGILCVVCVTLCWGRFYREYPQKALAFDGPEGIRIRLERVLINSGNLLSNDHKTCHVVFKISQKLPEENGV